MLEEPLTSNLISFRLAIRTAAVAAMFSLVVAALLLYDYLHRGMKDPGQDAAYQALKLANKQQPKDEAMAEELRKLDAELRKEYFRERAFTLSGGVLLCGGIIVALAAAKWAATLRRKLPQPQPEAAAHDSGSLLDPGCAMDRRRAVRRARPGGHRFDLAVAHHCCRRAEP